MGVMKCSRNQCESVMCDRYSPKFGYLCERCAEQLKNSTLMLTDEGIAFFMSTCPDPEVYKTRSEEVDEIFKFE